MPKFKNIIRWAIIIGLTLLLEIGWRVAIAQVTIPNEVAEYFLEQNDRAKALEIQGKIKDQIIANLEKQVTVSSQIVVTYVHDGTLYQRLIQIKDEEMAYLKDTFIKEIRRQKFMKVVIIVGVIVEHIILIAVL